MVVESRFGCIKTDIVLIEPLVYTGNADRGSTISMGRIHSTVSVKL